MLLIEDGFSIGRVDEGGVCYEGHLCSVVELVGLLREHGE